MISTFEKDTSIRNLPVKSTILLMEDLCEYLGDLKSMRGPQKKYESYSPGVRCVVEVGEITKDWVVVITPVIQRGQYHLDLWHDKNNPAKMIAVLFDHHFGSAASTYPMSYVEIGSDFESDIEALIGKSHYRRVAAALMLPNDPIGLAVGR